MRAVKKGILAILLLMVVFVVGACGNSQAQNDQPKEDLSKLPIDQRVDKMIEKMSDEQKVGQLIMIGIHGTTVNSDSRYMINHYTVGGIILFDRNMHNKAQVKDFISNLQKTARSAGEVAPMLIAIDQEGGMVARMSDKLVKVPSAQTLGQGSVAHARELALKSAKELKSLGFNVNFAPVVDLGLAYQRSFSKDPKKVTAFAEAVGSAYHEAGLLFSFKHFPGIGKAKTDLHKETNVISVSKSELDKEDWQPYEKIIPKMDNWNYMVMVSHAIYPSLEPGKPASLSKVAMQDILRKKMGFKGVIITDDMEMGAVANHYTFGNMSVEAINAGADIVMVDQEYSHEQAAYNGILKAVKSGKISKARLNEAVKRVLIMKLKNGLVWK